MRPSRRSNPSAEHLGFNQPIPIQFLGFLGRAIQGDFGTSTRTLEPALGHGPGPAAGDPLPGRGRGRGLAPDLDPTGHRGGGPAGVVARPDRPVGGRPGQAVPGFVLGQVLILVFAVSLRILPVSGAGDPAYLILPAIVIGLGSAAGLTRILRSSLLDVIGSDYIRTARAKGLGPRPVILRHALRNAAIPFVTFLAFDLAAILSGVIVVEVVFSYPGMGLLVVQAVTNRDVPVIQAFTFVAALTIVDGQPAAWTWSTGSSTRGSGWAEMKAELEAWPRPPAGACPAGRSGPRGRASRSWS